MARRPSESSEVVSCEGWRAKGLVLHFKQVEAFSALLRPAVMGLRRAGNLVSYAEKVQALRGCGGRGSRAGAGVENLFEFDGGESALADFD